MAPPPTDAHASADAPATPVAEAAPRTDELSPAACGARLAELFPALFIAPHAPGPFKPIKLRIHADIQARAPGLFTKRTLGIFFSRYTTSTAYLKALASASHRFDLDGAPAGEIAEEHRAAAAEELARRRALVLERRAAERKAQMAQQPAPPAVAPEGDAAPTERPPRVPQAARPPRDRPAAERRSHGAADRPRRDAPRSDERNGPSRRPSSAGPRPAPRGHAPPRHDPRHDARPAARPEHAPSAPAMPVDPAQRERALLLRAFEASPLSKANFCVLKRISEAELDAVLAQARADRADRG